MAVPAPIDPAARHALRPSLVPTPMPGTPTGRALRIGLALAGVGVSAADLFLPVRALWHLPISVVQALVLLGALRIAWKETSGRWRPRVASVVVALVALAFVASKIDVALSRARAAGAGSAYSLYSVLVLAAIVALPLIGHRVVASFGAQLARTPTRLSALSFAAISVFGGIVLTLPPSLQRIRSASLVDGIFTATSAVCVTGLTVNDVPATYSRFGQIVIMALVQIGGLGIMALAAAVGVVAGRRLQIRSAVALSEVLDSESLASIRGQLRFILAWTFGVEAVGVAVLWARFASDPATAGNAFFLALFHAVSAFGNAGFALFPGNLTPYAGDWTVCLTIAGLIVLGGIGFPVAREVLRLVRESLAGRRGRRPSLHTILACTATALLLVGGTVGFLVLEAGRPSMRGLPIGDRLLAAIFQSATTRTAGFNTIDFGAVGAPALFFTIVLMFIGACPSSTGGGIKTTTAATLAAALWAEIRGRPQTRILRRAISPSTVRKAMGTMVVSLAIVSLMFFLLCLVEDHPFDRLLFETVSAFATVGLSTGITPSLGATGKVIVILTMLVGRVGPLTLAIAFASPGRPAAVTLPEERVLIG